MNGNLARNLVVGLLFAVLLGGTGWFFGTHFEASWDPVTSSSDAAGKNPMLGAQRFLEHRGYQVKVEATLSTALFQPLPQGTLILSDGGDSMLATQSQALLSWVERGNTLIVTPTWRRPSFFPGKSRAPNGRATQNKDSKDKGSKDAAAAESQDAIAAHFGVSLGPSSGRDELCRSLADPEDDKKIAPPNANKGGKDNKDDKDGKPAEPGFTYVDCVATLTLPGVKHALRLDGSEASLVTGKAADCGCDNKNAKGKAATKAEDEDEDSKEEDDAKPAADDPADAAPAPDAEMAGTEKDGTAAAAPKPQIADDDARAVRIYAWGKGRVVLLAENYFDNYRLPAYDHGELLLGLAALNTKGRNVTLIQHVDVASWIDILWHASPYSICALAVFLLLWAWSAMRRFGPQLPDPDDRRRALLEHVDASGRWLWKSVKGREIMLAAMRHATERVLARRIPELRKMPQERQIERLAADGKMSRADLERALLDAPGRLPIEFTRQIQTLQELRAHYER